MRSSVVGYVVRYTVTIDRPERRNSTFPEVPAGTKIRTEERHASLSTARTRVAALVGGQDDFGGEYVSMVEAIRRMYQDPNAGGRRAWIGWPVMRRRVGETIQAESTRAS